MQAYLPVHTGADHLDDPRQAEALCRCIELLLEGEDAGVVLDFTGIDGVSEAFLDALFGPLQERFGPVLADRLHLDGCSAVLLADMRGVAEQGRPAEIGRAAPRQPRSAAA